MTRTTKVISPAAMKPTINRVRHSRVSSTHRALSTVALFKHNFVYFFVHITNVGTTYLLLTTRKPSSKLRGGSI